MDEASTPLVAPSQEPKILRFIRLLIAKSVAFGPGGRFGWGILVI